MRRLLPLFLLTACAREVVIENVIDPSAPAKVLSLGDVLAETKGAELRVKLPKKHRRDNGDGTSSNACLWPTCPDYGDTPELTVRLETSCGTAEYCIRWEKGEAFRATLYERKREPYDTCLEEQYTLWVDNRGGTAHTLTVASLKREIAANATVKIEIPQPPCEAMAQIALDGETIGALPVNPDGSEYAVYRDAAKHFLIDASGARCYQETTYSYSPGSSGPGPSGASHDKKRFHALGALVDHFLEKAPETITSPYGVGSLTQLVERECT